MTLVRRVYRAALNKNVPEKTQRAIEASDRCTGRCPSADLGRISLKINVSASF